MILKKIDRKRNLIWLSDFNSGKVVLILLIKIMILYVKSTTIDLQRRGLELCFK